MSEMDPGIKQKTDKYQPAQYMYVYILRYHTLYAPIVYMYKHIKNNYKMFFSILLNGRQSSLNKTNTW